MSKRVSSNKKVPAYCKNRNKSRKSNGGRRRNYIHSNKQSNMPKSIDDEGVRQLIDIVLSDFLLSLKQLIDSFIAVIRGLTSER